MVQWPNGVAIDFFAERLYWVDAKIDYIASADLDGKNVKKILEATVSPSFRFSLPSLLPVIDPPPRGLPPTFPLSISIRTFRFLPKDSRKTKEKE